MYQNKPEWFSAPRDVLPDSTITPGRLIVDPRTPEGPPYLDAALSIPATDLRVTNYPYQNKKEDEKGGSFGLFASFMSAFGVGGDLSGNLKSGRSLDIDVDDTDGGFDRILPGRITGRGHVRNASGPQSSNSSRTLPCPEGCS